MVDERAFFDNFAAVLGGADRARMQPFMADGAPLSRLDAHSNNFAMTCIAALSSTFKVVRTLVGDEYFTALARAYIQKTPPEHSSLTFYGAGFAQFLRSFEPAQKQVPYIAPIASLDWAWFRAYQAADEPALSGQDLQGVAPQLLPTRAPGLHASVQLLRFSIPAYSLWKINAGNEENPDPVDMNGGREWAVIWRQNNQVQHTALSQAEYNFLDAIGFGRSFAEGWTDAIRHDAHFDLKEQFSRWLVAGVFKGEKND